MVAVLGEGEGASASTGHRVRESNREYHLGEL